MERPPRDDAASRESPRGLAGASPQFFKFVAVSGVAAATNFFSRMLFSLVAPYPVAIVLAYCLGMTVAFSLNRWLVFSESTNSLRKQMVFFVLVNLFGLAQTLVVSLVLAHWLLPWLGVTTYVEEIAHAVGIAVPTVSSYLGHKYLSFRRH
ncbi:GtrA family protein [Tahibacter soli]|uniref:GtrA family protein n=1 Tax=Tahibacter soli TaxID=2983605 RepID=A0A9X4BGI0_9GAMM|nr:GtrA family protein [Tahibacter soli]MDC8011098.1 GtrA family protein [Tahibacter soli]